MKKTLLIVILCLTFVLINAELIVKASIDSDEEGTVFLTGNTDKVERYLLSKTNKLDMAAHDLKKEKGIEGEIIFGKPITIRNVEDIYYIPVFIESKCVSILIVGSDPNDENGYCMQMSKYFADVINDLPNGTYYFEKDFDLQAVCLIGKNTKIIVDANKCLDYANITQEKINIVTALAGENERDIEEELYK